MPTQYNPFANQPALMSTAEAGDRSRNPTKSSAVAHTKAGDITVDTTGMNSSQAYQAIKQKEGQFEDYIAAPTAPALDPRYQDVMNQQNELAKAFRANIDNLAANEDRTRQEAGHKELKQGLMDTDKAYNRRGLLYGGQRLASRSNLRSDLATKMAQGRYDTNQKLLDTATVMERAPIETGFGMANAGQQQFSAQQSSEQAALDAALRERNAGLQGTNALFGAAGNIGGKIASKYLGATNA